MIQKRHILWLLGGLVCALGAALIVGIVVRGTVTANVVAHAEADARLRQALMANEIARFRLLPLALADDGDLAALMQAEARSPSIPPYPARITRPQLGGSLEDTIRAAEIRAAETPPATTPLAKPPKPSPMDRKLERLSHEFGSPIVYVMRQDGLAIAASNWRYPDSFVGLNYGFRPYFRNAARTGMGEQFALGTVSKRPGLYFARRATGNAVIVMKMGFDRIEAQWRDGRGETFVTDKNGIILATSQPNWRYHATRPLPNKKRLLARDYLGVPDLPPVPFHRVQGDRVRIDGKNGLYLHVKTAENSSRLQVNLLVPMAEVDYAVRAAQLGAALLTLSLFAFAFYLRQRSRRRTVLMAELESAVAERTADLRREIEERAAAEDHASQLREGLRQANRLATLGQVTASVAHETAQPVAAIRNYAATSRQLLDMNAADDVRTNLAAIDRLAQRIGTVTAELRGFARKGSQAGRPIALIEVVDGACLLLKERLSHVQFRRPHIAPDLIVFGGHVRLEQVLVNVLQNAVEALQGRPNPSIWMHIEQDPEWVRIFISDNGPGIAPELAGRLFTPFATSRPSGLGLGLVIAKDIAENFGGNLELMHSEENEEKAHESGSCFRITLRRIS